MFSAKTGILLIKYTLKDDDPCLASHWVNIFYPLYKLICFTGKQMEHTSVHDGELHIVVMFWGCTNLDLFNPKSSYKKNL